MSDNRILMWRTNGVLFGIPLLECLEVERARRVHRVPHVKNYIAGIANLRGEVVTGVDLDALLKQEPTRILGGADLIRLRKGKGQFAFAGDELVDIVDLPHANLKPAPGHLSAREQTLIDGIAETEHGLALLPLLESILKEIAAD